MVRKKQMTESELAEDLYAHRHDAEEWSETAEQIESRPAGTAVISCRLPREELDALEQAASSSGETLSQFVRKAVSLRIGVRTPQFRVATGVATEADAERAARSASASVEQRAAPYSQTLPAQLVTVGTSQQAM